ncbi:MAG: bifunctional chorismate mutase/prephenate dehydrogenase [Paraglaciecola sp.]|uniref:bifunctional chorismate mutase/prephenate dehydrogenase n=1 Tax=Paraglaciecola sp. TaxID=1920173 RepID=UPI00273ECCF1|nr:bifunctional chorismate mutase/prephenate dehydrogenase [Paraglaciecola sp.]MDP5030259.1 bifunctional chorismate mutase/prephenate dehydrogenase [Paraglaciecola sp.]MDP5133846.1 bifunctional chorismate mutase/prephenate dehydrogenase [Paraglaciecola sp.]
MTEPSISLDELRIQIDKIDSQMVELLAQRAKITAQVGQYKSRVGLPIYVPEREAELISKRREQAEAQGVSPTLVEDLLRRIMRESYHTQNVNYLCTNPEIKKIVVVGGAGALGRIFVDMFTRSGYSVTVLEKADWQNSDAIFEDAGLVLVAVPIQMTEEIISRLQNLPKDCLLVDITSTKQKPLNAMLNAHSGPVLGLHPMFGPDVPSLVKQVVVVCHGRDETKYQWLLQQMTIWGAILQHSDAKDHDDAMVFIQVMRHFCSFVFGAHLASENPDLKQLVSLSSPIYRLELAMVGRLFAQDPALYADIIFDNKDSVRLLSKFAQQFAQALTLVEANDKREFIKQFLQIGAWFGDYSKQSLIDSKKLLLKADDDRTWSE